MMVPFDPRHQPRIRVDVELRLVDGEVLMGTLFVNPDQRVSDLFNSGATFLPFERADGVFEIIAKNVVARVRPFDQERAQGVGLARRRRLSRATRVE